MTEYKTKLQDEMFRRMPTLDSIYPGWTNHFKHWGTRQGAAWDVSVFIASAVINGKTVAFAHPDGWALVDSRENVARLPEPYLSHVQELLSVAEAFRET